MLSVLGDESSFLVEGLGKAVMTKVSSKSLSGIFSKTRELWEYGFSITILLVMSLKWRKRMRMLLIFPEAA